MDMGRIHNHKEVKFMKKFNLAKGLVISLLTFALVLTGFAAVKASAADESNVIVFKTDAEGSEAEYTISYTPGTPAVADNPETEDVDETAEAVPAKVADSSKLALDYILGQLGSQDKCLYLLGSGSIKSVPAKVTLNSTDSSNKFFEIANDATGEINVTIPVNSPKVTFKVIVKDLIKTGTDSESTADGKFYTFVADAEADFQKASKNLKVSDILAKAENESKETLQDPTAWVVYGDIAQVEEVKYATDKFTLTANLAADREVTFTVVSSKVPVTFTYDPYSAEFVIDNKKGKTDILFSDIVAALKKDDGDGGEVGLEGENVLLKDGFATGGTTNGKYSTWKYTWELEAVVNAAPAAKEIAEGKVVPAFEVTIDETKLASGYDPASDSIVFLSPVELTVYWTDCKKSAGVQIKGSQLKTLDLKLNSDKTAYVGSIPLNDKDNGVKIAENKTAYIYASMFAPAEDKAKYTGNYVVDATPYKKIEVGFAYAQAEDKATDIAITSIKTVDTKKKTIVYKGEQSEENTNYLGKVIEYLQYSEDGNTWISIYGEWDSKTSKIVKEFNLGKLYELINGGSKSTLYFRLSGDTAQEAVEDDPETEEDESKAAANAYRACKPIKVGIAPAKDAKAVKIDVTKNTIALKNGYDFTMTAKDTDTPKLTDADGAAIAWTILPFNKGGKAKREEVPEGETEAVKVDTSYVPTVGFAPVKKATEDAEAFTNIKVKSFSIADVATLCGKSVGGNGSLYIWVRKSATVAKPAEKWVLVTVSQITEAPTIKADKSGYFSVQDKDDKKGVLAAPEISNAKTDKNSGSYEYLIVDAADIIINDEGKARANIDETTAKWTVLSDKGLTIGKSKSKYAAKVGAKASDHVLKDGSIVLVRRAGDKSSAILASDYYVTTVAKATITLKVQNAEGKDENKDFSLFVWKEYKAATE
jgi:hypothetical protein